VLLGGLEVKGVAGGPSLAASDQTFATVTWSRPTGTAIVYAPTANKTLEKVFVNGTAPQHVTPLPPSRYLSVTFHPSGEAYAFAVDHRAELRYIPCFCGCGTSAGHRDNFDCFVKDQTAPGTFILDPHGFACGTCVGVALDTKALLASGLSLKAIRAAIDAKWSEVGPATPTPYPDE